MYNVKANFSHQYKDNIFCNICDESEEDTQKHLLICEGLDLGHNSISEKYEDIFGNNPNKVYEMFKIMEKKMRKRENIEKTRNS